MTLQPKDVEAIFQESSPAAAPALRSNEAGEESAVAEEEETARTRKLKDVLTTCQDSWSSGSEALSLVAEKIGDGARNSVWRLPLGESGVLGFFIGLLAREKLRQPLRVQALRIIGNSCADTDENRSRVVEAGLLSNELIRILEDDSILPFAVPVIYNICVDYEPAQLEVCKAGLSKVFVNIVSSERLSNYPHLLGIICKILALVVTHDQEFDVANTSSPSLLLALATSDADEVDLEDFSSLTSVALAYLTNEKFQIELLRGSGFELLQEAFENSYTHFDMVTSDPDEVAELKQVWNAFVQVVADISALPSFATKYTLGSATARRLVTWLSQTSRSHLQVAACLCLGNLSRSDEASTELLKDVQEPLERLLTANLGSEPAPSSQPPPSGPATVSTSSQLLHAGLSFLKNLAIPPANKPLLGTLLDQSRSVLPGIWSSTDVQPQVQFAAVSLTRLLLTGCPLNVKRLCMSLSPGSDSGEPQRSNVHSLVDVFRRSDAEPTKLEVGRAIAALCRVLHSNPVLPLLPDEWWWSSTAGAGADAYEELSFPPLHPSDAAAHGVEDEPETVRVPVARADADADELRRAHFYAAHPDIAEPLGALLTQAKFPTLRSEALFAFALMSRSADGARVVMRVLQPAQVCRALVEIVTGQQDAAEGGGLEEAGSSRGGDDGSAELVESLGLQPQQAPAQQTSDLAKIDRENGLVLVAELLRNFSEYLPPRRKAIFDEVLAKGGEAVLEARKQN